MNPKESPYRQNSCIHFSVFILTKHKSTSLPPTPIAGTSVFAPMCLDNSVMKLWQKRITSLSDLPLGSKSAPPFPPSAMWLSYFKSLLEC
jgi:hypothetical protein